MKIDYLYEIWKDIKGYEESYQISNYGQIRNKKTGKLLKLHLNNAGYLIVTLCKTTAHTYSVHRLVAINFISNPDNYPEVNHKDENKLNNFVWVNEDGTVDLDKSNLEWCSKQYNNNYGSRSNRISNKVKNGKKRSIHILQYDLDGNFIKEWPSMMEIHRQLGYSQGNISSYCSGTKKSAYGYIWKFKL